MKIHLQINPGGTFPVTACGKRILRCYAGKNVEVRPPLAFQVSVPRARCKNCEHTVEGRKLLRKARA